MTLWILPLLLGWCRMCLLQLLLELWRLCPGTSPEKDDTQTDFRSHFQTCNQHYIIKSLICNKFKSQKHGKCLSFWLPTFKILTFCSLRKSLLVMGVTSNYVWVHPMSLTSSEAGLHRKNFSFFYCPPTRKLLRVTSYFTKQHLSTHLLHWVDDLGQLEVVQVLQSTRSATASTTHN